jgi:hypothetical protein
VNVAQHVRTTEHQDWPTFTSAVRALKSLQKAMMLRPAWPSAGPTGGAGLAWPAGTSSLTTDLTVFDMRNLPFVSGDHVVASFLPAFAVWPRLVTLPGSASDASRRGAGDDVRVDAVRYGLYKVF